MTPSKSRKRGAPRAHPAGERLQKVLAAAGIASRRAAEALIREGRVEVNGKIVRELGTRADPSRQRITVDGERIGRPARLRYYVVHKPRGVVSTARDSHAKRTVLDLVPGRTRLFPVGRLDAQTEGLLLLTNDGPLAQRLLHPSFEVPRVYRASVAGRVTAPVLRKLTQGVEIDGRTSSVRSVQLLDQAEDRSLLELELVEGRRHQIRKLLAALGHPVRRLVRTSFGPLRLGGLRPGEWRKLDEREARALQRLSDGA